MIEYNKKIILSDKLSCGYKFFYDKTHPLANNNAVVYYHRHIMSIKMGRWVNKKEVVHHLDGNRLNNSIKNLLTLSIPEHAGLERARKRMSNKCAEIICCIICLKQLSKKNKTYFCKNCLNNLTGENSVEYKKKLILPKKYCFFCKKEISKQGKFGICSKCFNFNKIKRKFNPDKTELAKDVWDFPMYRLSTKYNVSDKIIARRCHELNIELPPRGYWARKTRN